MTRLCVLIGGEELALLAASYSLAMDATIRQSDLGAGPIVAHATSCLIANRSHRGAPCPEPQVSQAPGTADRVANRLDRALFFIDAQDFDKARAETELALAIDPNDMKARLLQARLSLTLADLPRAEADLALARKQAPDDPDVRATHAWLLLSKPAKLESLREFEAVILKHPHYRFAREQRGQLLMNFGRYADALEDLDFVVENNPPDANSLLRRSEAFRKLGKPQSAIADLSAAIKLEPNQFLLVAARANANARAGLGELALRDYDAVLAMDHGAPLYVMFGNERAKLLTRRAYVYVALKRFDEAAGEMLTAISLGGVPAILRAKFCCAGMAFQTCRSTVMIRRSCVRR